MWGWSRQDRAVWGSGPRGAAPLGWYHQKVTLYNICSLEPHRTQPRPATAALLPSHALHLRREHQHGLNERPSRDRDGKKTNEKRWKRVGASYYSDDESDDDYPPDAGHGDDPKDTSNKGKKYNVFGDAARKMNAEGDKHNKWPYQGACMSNPYIVDTSCAIEQYHSSYLQHKSRRSSPTRR